MTHFMHQQLLSALLEKIINKALSLNIKDNHALTELEQKTLTLSLAELGFPLCFSVEAGQVLVTGLTERSDCSLSTSVKTLAELQKTQQLTELIKQDKLDIQGDLKVAQQFAALFDNLTIDWRSELAKHLGDIPAYKLEQFSLWLGNKLGFAAKQIQADASEWLVHEKRLVVTSSQIADFCQQVNSANQELELLTQRLDKLEQIVRSKASCE